MTAAERLLRYVQFDTQSNEFSDTCPVSYTHLDVYKRQDRDSIIALSGAPRRELVDRRNSADLENLMEQRKSYRYSPGNVKLRAVEGSEKYYLGAAAPIVAQGDLMGCVMLLMDEEETPPAEGDQKLVQTVAGFLGKQMEA